MTENNKIFTYKNIIFAVMIVLVIAFISKIVDIAIMLFMAFVVTCAINPIIKRLEKFMPRVLAVSLVLFIVILSTLLIFIPLLVLSIKQCVVFLEHLPHYINKIRELSHLKIFGFTVSNYINLDSLKAADANIANLTRGILSQGITFGKLVANSFTSMLAVSIMVFYMSYDSKLIMQRFLAFFPEKFKKKTKEIIASIASKVGGYVIAQGLAMMIVGVLTFIGLLLIGNKHALLLGFITCLLDIVPVIGATIAVAIGIYTALKGGFVYVLLTFFIFLLAQWLQNQIFRPILFGKLMDMHPLLIIISLLIGAKFLGFWGVVLAPAIASVVCVLADELYIKAINKEQV